MTQGRGSALASPSEEQSDDEEIAIYCSDCLRNASPLTVLTVGYLPLMFLVYLSHASVSLFFDT
jgi:hypothetical protein